MQTVEKKSKANEADKLYVYFNFGTDGKRVFCDYMSYTLNIHISLFAHIEHVSIEQLNYYIHNIYNNK